MYIKTSIIVITYSFRLLLLLLLLPPLTAAVTDYIIATTHITTANKLVNSILMETPNTQLAHTWDQQQGSPKPTYHSSAASVGKRSRKY